MNFAACILFWNNEDNKILAVSRKDNPDAFGLPGGKLDEKDGGSLTKCAIRESLEETGFHFTDLELFFVRQDGEFICATFMPWNSKRVRNWTPEANAGNVDWVTPEKLIAGPFGEYNKKLFDHVGIPYDSKT
jgi:8-oxo-dGTP pyrophosphatase MutT (NUDIX family)